VDTLDDIADDHPGRAESIAILRDLVEAIAH
jgi:hypothetical protein